MAIWPQEGAEYIRDGVTLAEVRNAEVFKHSLTLLCSSCSTLHVLDCRAATSPSEQW